MSRFRSWVGWLATGALAAAMLAHAAGLISQAALDHVGLVSIGWLVFRLAERRAGARGAALAALALGGGLALTRLFLPDLQYMPYLLVVPAEASVAWLFVSGFRPGHEPILLRLIRLMGVSPAEDPGFRRFIAGQCLVWAGLSLATACLAFAAILFVAAHPWLAELLAWLFGAQAVWFVVSHHYASFRYGRPEGWWTTAQAMLRPDTWSRLLAR